MTTVAWRDGVIAADTGWLNCGMTSIGTVKVARNAYGDLCGVCGDATFAFRFLHWFLGGEVGAPDLGEKDEEDYINTALIARAEGHLEIWEPDGVYHVTPEYYAVGSGRAYAMGAMHHGADAIQAVHAALVHDTGTNGDVMSVRRDTPRPKRRR